MAVLSVCSIKECDKPSYRRGWCGGHYERYRRHGDPLGGGTGKGEVWGYLQETVIPYRADSCLPWPFAKDFDGYGKLTRHGVCQYAHRLACEAVHGPAPSPKHEAAHLCGKGHEGCVNPMHLVWATSKQNKQHKFVHGTTLRGSSVTNSKLTEGDVSKIRTLLKSTPMLQIAKRFGVSPSCIAVIRDGKSWRHVK